MSIKVSCRCGKKLAVKDEYAGRKMKCPACQKSVQIPQAEREAGFSDDEWDDSQQTESRTPPRRTSSSPARRQSASPGSGSKSRKPMPASSRGLIIGVSVGGGVVIVAMLLAWLLWPRAAAENLAGNPSGAAPPAAQSAVPPAAAVPVATPGGPVPVISMPRAVSKLPDWIAQDAPFDLRQYWVEVPVAENAAPIYLDALYEFEPIMEMYFPAEVRPQRTPAVAERAAQSFKLQVEWYRDSGKRDTTARDTVLQQHEVGFRKLREAQQRPRCVFESGWDIPSQGPLIIAVREALRVAQLQIERDIDRGDFDAAIQMTGSMLRLGRDLRVRTPLALQLVADAADAIVTSSIVTPLLKSPALKASQCETLLRLLIQHDVAIREINPALARLRGDYLLKRLLLYQVQNSTDEFAPSRIKSAFGATCDSRGDAMLASLNADPAVAASLMIELPPPDYGRVLDAAVRTMQPADFDVSAALLKESYQLQADALTQPYAAQAAAFTAWDQRQQATVGSIMAAAQSAVPQGTPPNQSMAAVIPILEKALNEPNAPRGQLLRTLWNSKIENDLSNGRFIGETDARGRTRQSAMLALAALRYWYATQSTPPGDLASVCRSAGLTEVPRDFYGNGPLQMITFQTDSPPIQYPHGRPSDKAEKFLAGETVIYSVGPDGVDDRAASDWAFNPNTKGDWPFYLGRPQNQFSVSN